MKKQYEVRVIKGFRPKLADYGKLNPLYVKVIQKLKDSKKDLWIWVQRKYENRLKTVKVHHDSIDDFNMITLSKIFMHPDASVVAIAEYSNGSTHKMFKDTSNPLIGKEAFDKVIEDWCSK